MSPYMGYRGMGRSHGDDMSEKGAAWHRDEGRVDNRVVIQHKVTKDKLPQL